MNSCRAGDQMQMIQTKIYRKMRAPRPATTMSAKVSLSRLTVATVKVYANAAEVIVDSNGRTIDDVRRQKSSAGNGGSLVDHMQQTLTYLLLPFFAFNL